MGDFCGHLIPGLAIFIFGIYQGVLTLMALLRDHFSLSYPRSKKRQSWFQRLPLGGLMKVLFGTASFLHEILSLHSSLVVLNNHDLQWNFIFPEMWQHITMFTVFILSGFVDLVSQVCLAKRRLGLELGVQVLAIFVLVLLMSCHLRHMEGIEKQSHALFLLPVSLLALVMTIELWVPNKPQLWVIKSWLLLLTGTWLIQMAFMLFHPLSGHAWVYNRENIMFLTTFFCWHVVADALLLGAIYTFFILWHRYCGLAPALGESMEVKYHLYLPGSPDELPQEAELEGHIQSTFFLQSPP